MNQHRPTVAAVVTGLVGSLLAWGITALPAGIPADVTGWLGAAAILIAGMLGAAAGRIAERHTWSEQSVDIIRREGGLPVQTDNREEMEDGRQPPQYPDWTPRDGDRQ